MSKKYKELEEKLQVQINGKIKLEKELKVKTD